MDEFAVFLFLVMVLVGVPCGIVLVVILVMYEQRLRALREETEKLGRLAGEIEKLRHEVRELAKGAAVAPMVSVAVETKGSGLPVLNEPPEAPPPIPSYEPVSESMAHPRTVLGMAKASADEAPPPVCPDALAPPPVPSEKREMGISGQGAGESNWEQFLGAKLFAWLGGLALFLGIVFFLKLAFDRDWIPVWARLLGGAGVGIGMAAAGWRFHRTGYAALGHSLTGSGMVVLYAVLYSAHAYYRLLGPEVTFAGMAVVTAMALSLAVRLEARAIAVLGLVAGFLTPFILNTPEPNRAGLFGYIAFLDVGLLVVTCWRPWPWLRLCGAAGTVCVQAAWLAGTQMDPWADVLTLVFFLGMFVGMMAWAARYHTATPWDTCAAILPSAFAVLASAGFLTGAGDPKPGLVLMMSGGLAVLAATAIAPAWMAATGCLGLFSFAMIGFWSLGAGSDQWLGTLLTANVVLAVMYGIGPLAVLRWRKDVPMDGAWGATWMPLAAMLVMFGPLVGSPEPPVGMWMAFAMLLALAWGLAAGFAAIWMALGALFLMLIALGLFILTGQWHADEMWGLLGIFAVILAGGSIAMAGWRRERLDSGGWKIVPAFGAGMPFVLVAMLIFRFHSVEPILPGAFALVLTLLLIGAGRFLAAAWLGAVAFAGATLVQIAAHLAAGGHPAEPEGLLAMHLVFGAVFLIWPLVLASSPASTVAWATAALSGVVHFALVYPLLRDHFAVWPLGIVPAAFAVAYGLATLAAASRMARDNPARRGALAWMGGAMLLFITLVFPIQFEHESLTLGWAFEGAALIWWFRRVPHPGLPVWGLALLLIALARLTFEPLAFPFYERTDALLWNGRLSTYVPAALAMFAGAIGLQAHRPLPEPLSAKGLLMAAGVWLLFLFVNIEIANAFSTGRVIVFDFSGSLAQNMSYSIAWAIFALAMLVWGIFGNLPAARYASVALLLITIGKLFMHDIAHLDALYRIAAFLAVAIVLILASYLYQRWVVPRLSKS